MLIIVWLINVFSVIFAKCPKVSITEASGSYAPKGPYCSGQLIFSDDFETLSDKWQHEQDLSGGGNGEFQWYTKNPSVTFIKNNSLHIKPTLLTDHYGEEFLTSGTLDLDKKCTKKLKKKKGPRSFYCNKTGSNELILNPIMSARLRTNNRFSFKYGAIEINAKLPAGDWLWPAVWLYPQTYKKYGRWPTSGEIDILESRGNRNITVKGKPVGVQKIGVSVHFGPSGHRKLIRYGLLSENVDFSKRFNKYKLVWYPDEMAFLVNDELIGVIYMDEGFWEIGDFEKTDPGVKNPWINGTKSAPFDEEFYIILNLAVGGSYFSDQYVNYPGHKPWVKDSPTAITDFWKGRQQWLPTWNYNKTDDSHFQIDYVKVWAL